VTERNDLDPADVRRIQVDFALSFLTAGERRKGRVVAKLALMDQDEMARYLEGAGMSAAQAGLAALSFADVLKTLEAAE
jgi:hypothetical protein